LFPPNIKKKRGEMEKWQPVPSYSNGFGEELNIGELTLSEVKRFVKGGTAL